MTSRGRITLPDLVHLLAAFAFLAALAPVLWVSLKGSSSLGAGELYLWQLVIPISVLVMMGIIWRKAVGGAS